MASLAKRSLSPGGDGDAMGLAIGRRWDGDGDGTVATVKGTMASWSDVVNACADCNAIGRLRLERLLVLELGTGTYVCTPLVSSKYLPQWYLHVYLRWALTHSYTLGDTRTVARGVEWCTPAWPSSAATAFLEARSGLFLARPAPVQSRQYPFWSIVPLRVVASQVQQQPATLSSVYRYEGKHFSDNHSRLPNKLFG